jgi:transcriptional regulator with XRE-family HTH domain
MIMNATGAARATAKPKDQAQDEQLVGLVGRVVARERAKRGLTIAQLAASSRVSAGLLSQIERGIGNPSIDTAAKVARALGVPIGTFFVGQDPSNDLVRPESRKRLVLADHNLVYELLVPDFQGALSMLRIELPSGYCNEDAPFSHRGEEAMLIVEGSLAIHLGHQTYHMHAQDSLRFASTVDHWYEVGDEPVVVISAMTPPPF